MFCNLNVYRSQVKLNANDVFEEDVQFRMCFISNRKLVDAPSERWILITRSGLNFDYGAIYLNIFTAKCHLYVPRFMWTFYAGGNKKASQLMSGARKPLELNVCTKCVGNFPWWRHLDANVGWLSFKWNGKRDSWRTRAILEGKETPQSRPSKNDGPLQVPTESF